MTSIDAAGEAYEQFTIETVLDRSEIGELMAAVWRERRSTAKVPVLELDEGPCFRLLGRLTFTMVIEDRPSGTRVRSRIDHGLRRRGHLLGLVEVGPARLDGHSDYASFCRRFADRVRRADPAARVEVSTAEVPADVPVAVR